MSTNEGRDCQNRRAALLEAALANIVTHGVAGVTLRSVADSAGVALGSIGYYFGDKDGLLSAAFARFAEESAVRFASFYEGVDSLPAARAATVEMLVATANSRRDVILGSELYGISLRRPRHRITLTQWTSACRNVLHRYFYSRAVYAIDALYEGLILHRRMRLGDYADDTLEFAVERLTPPEAYIGP